MKLLMTMADRAWLPDPLIRLGIRRLNRMRLRGEAVRHGAERIASIKHFANKMRHSPVAIRPDKANDQHYELPAAFFKQVLGTHLKYSCALWLPGVDDLNRAETDMLALTARHAKLGDGMQILELGCGWGSLTLWMAVHFPGSRIVAVSNSASQRRFIETRCREQGIDNVQIITADMNCFSTDQRFDRVVSVEMFEFMACNEVWDHDGGREWIVSHYRMKKPARH